MRLAGPLQRRALGGVALAAESARSLEAGGQACGRPLGEVRASWRAAQAERGPDACARKESLWTEIRRCYAGYGEWVPDLREVGDCYVATRDEAGARAFYGRTVETLRAQICTHDGWTCARAAAVELRLIDCGFEWLASSPEEAWRRFAAAIRTPATALPTAFGLEPVVDTDEPTAAPDLACRPAPESKQAHNGGRAFGVPNAILRNATPIAYAAPSSNADALRRAVSVDLDEDERRQTRPDPGAPERLLRIQACPFTRPHLGPPGQRFYIELNLATASDRDTANCASPLTWIARRLP